MNEVEIGIYIGLMLGFGVGVAVGVYLTEKYYLNIKKKNGVKE